MAIKVVSRYAPKLVAFSNSSRSWAMCRFDGFNSFISSLVSAKVGRFKPLPIRPFWWENTEEQRNSFGLLPHCLACLPSQFPRQSRIPHGQAGQIFANPASLLSMVILAELAGQKCWSVWSGDKDSPVVRFLPVSYVIFSRLGKDQYPILDQTTKKSRSRWDYSGPVDRRSGNFLLWSVILGASAVFPVQTGHHCAVFRLDSWCVERGWLPCHHPILLYLLAWIFPPNGFCWKFVCCCF